MSMTNLRSIFLGQRCQKGILQIFIGINITLAGIEKFGRAFHPQFESGFRQVSGTGIHDLNVYSGFVRT